MEDNKHCYEDECTNQVQMVCRVHASLLCSFCSSSFHASCGVTEIGNLEIIKHAMKITESLLSTIDENGKLYNLESRFPGFNQNLTELQNELDEFKEIATKVEEENDLYQIHILQDKIFCLKAKLDSSYCFISFSTFMAHRREALKAKGVAEELVERKRLNEMIEEAKQRIQRELKEQQEIFIAEEHQKMKQEFDYMKEDLENKCTLAIEEATNKLKDKEQEMEELKEKMIEEIKSKDDLIENLEVQSTRCALLKYIHNKNYNSKAEFSHYTEITLDLRNEKDRAFVKEYASLRVKLPEITRLKIDYLSKCEEVKVFMKYCFPFKMRFFTFNSESYEVLNMEDYIDSMAGILSCVTEEVFLLMTHMKNSETINRVVRACSKTERVIFRSCEMFADDACNFIIDTKHSNYKTKLMHFSNASYVTNWSKRPDRFENVAKGIASSPLAESLKTVVVNNAANCIGYNRVEYQV